MKKTIAIDIDEVLFPFVEAFVVENNTKYKTDLTPEDFFTYEFHEVLGLDIQETFKRVYAVHHAGYDNYLPLDGSVDALGRLANSFDLVIVTARNPRFAEATGAWLDSHFGGIFNKMIAIGHPAEVSKPQAKAALCVELDAVALVDDSIKHVSRCEEYGIQGILFGDYPWNRYIDIPSSAVACKDWFEVLEYFEDYETNKF